LNYQKLSYSGFYINLASQQANTTIRTDVDWENRNIVISNVKYSWFTWSNTTTDTPILLVTHYSGPRISYIEHKWNVNQNVNLTIYYLIIGRGKDW
jgi:hypothetical protein